MNENEDQARAFLAGVEAAFDELPVLDRLTFGMPTGTADVFGYTSHGPILALGFPIGILATYRGGVHRITGELMEVIGRCDCLHCHHDSDKPRYVARLLDDPETIVSHSRGSSYRVVGLALQNGL
jgi:hypothetical protein